jgi:hypothetical protein
MILRKFRGRKFTISRRNSSRGNRLVKLWGERVSRCGTTENVLSAEEIYLSMKELASPMKYACNVAMKEN